MKHIILVNPVAGNKKGIKYGKIVQKLLNKHNIDSKMYISKYKGHLTILAKELSSKDICRFYSIRWRWKLK